MTALRARVLVTAALAATLTFTAGVGAYADDTATPPAGSTPQVGDGLNATTPGEVAALLDATCGDVAGDSTLTCVSVTADERPAVAVAEPTPADPVTQLALDQEAVDLSADPDATLDVPAPPPSPVDVPTTDGVITDPEVSNLLSGRAGSELTFMVDGAALPRAAASPLRKVPLPDWCTYRDKYTRTEWCVRYTWRANIIKLSTRDVPRVVGTATGTMSTYIYTSTTVSHVINQTSITQTSGTGKSTLSVTGNLWCSGNCDYERGDLPTRNLPLNREITAIGDVSPTLPRTQQALSRLNWVMTIQLRNESSVPSELTAVTQEIRCDHAGARGVRGQGCVVPFDTKYFVYRYDPRFPTVAAHIEAALGSGLPGSWWNAVPLTRTTNQLTISANRKVACPRSLERPDGYTCDEYPFASTLEGAASGGSARVPPGCQLPEIEEVSQFGFSRCMVPNAEESAHGSNENSAQGSNLGLFYGSQRILNGEKFWVEVTYPT